MAAKQAKIAVAPLNMHQWIDANKASFLPPVCNKMMFGQGQLKIMFVGGPNVRNDFHIEEGEELFYQVKGDMVLRVMEKGKQKDIKIKEGEIFVLPGRIPHSPQRFEDTVGLVIERERHTSELDGLRYYKPEDSTAVLWERWFYCKDLGTQLGPLIKSYFDSEAHKTGKPQEGDVKEKTPVDIDVTTELPDPVPLKDMIAKHQAGTSSLFDCTEFKVDLHSITQPQSFSNSDGQLWLWLYSGQASTTQHGENFNMTKDDVILVEQNQSVSLSSDQDGTLVLAIKMQAPAVIS